MRWRMWRRAAAPGDRVKLDALPRVPDLMPDLSGLSAVNPLILQARPTGYGGTHEKSPSDLNE